MKSKLAVVVACVAIAGAFFLVLSRFTALPPLGARVASTAARDTADTLLGRAVTPVVAVHGTRSAVYPLRNARDAFAARVLLARAAERTLDVQYYIWHDDITGRLLFKALSDAARRGVRVRLLLDDNNTSGLDETLAALDADPKIEVRLFNPCVIRRPRLLNYITSFSRLNRRMHNKSFTVDNQAAIVGGRNIGDEYFDAHEGTVFADLDILAAGPVVRDVSSEFDRYWASASAYPVDRIVPHGNSADASRVRAELTEAERETDAAAYMNAINALPFVRQMIDHSLPLEWAAVRMISDDPDKVLGRADDRSLVSTQMQAIFGEPRTSLDLVSPYFVPGDFTGVFKEWSAKGVKIRVLTNALESTDVTAVHAGYAKRRKALLASGVKLYELRRTSGAKSGSSMGSSSSSLHAKTFAVDGSRVFVGSFNFDPRSMLLNTEMGFVIESPQLANEMGRVFETLVPANSYEVHLTKDGDLYWTRPDPPTRYETEPNASLSRRTMLWITSHLPIEWLL